MCIVIGHIWAHTDFSAVHPVVHHQLGRDVHTRPIVEQEPLVIFIPELGDW